MKSFRQLVFWNIVLPLIAYGQLSDTLLYRAAVGATSDSAKLTGLNRLIKSYPQSKLTGDAYGAQFSVLISLHQDSAAFVAVHNYLAARYSQMTRMRPAIAMPVSSDKLALEV